MNIFGRHPVWHPDGRHRSDEACLHEWVAPIRPGWVAAQILESVTELDEDQNDHHEVYKTFENLFVAVQL